MQPYRKQRQTFAEDTLAAIVLILAVCFVLALAAFETWYPGLDDDPATMKVVEIINHCEQFGYYDTGTTRIECKVVAE